MSGFTPVNQVRLTNVATVKLNKRGKRFEIACYRNKVLSWRNKLETDIREVLQIDTVFTNVSKGMLANTKDLQDAFGTTDQRLVCQEILDRGELQVSEQERGALYETIFRDIASIVADKTVNPENNRPYTINMIQNAMRQIQYSVNVSKSSKSQALEVIRKLRDIMPIARASMLIRVISSSADIPALTAELEQLGGAVTATSQAREGEPAVEGFVDLKLDPENLRKVEDFVKAFPGGRSRVEVLQLRMAGAAGVGVGGAVEGKDDFEEAEEEKVEASKSSKSKKTAAGVSKREEKLKNKKDDLSALLSEVTGRADIAGDSEGDEERVIAPSACQNKKKKKNKKSKSVDSDSDSDGHSGDERLNAKTTIAETTNSSTANKVKASKKEKRHEKEEKREKELQAKLLQERILNEKKKKEEIEQAAAEARAAQESSAANVEGEVATTEQQQIPVPTAAVTPATASAPASATVQSCNTCGGAFHDSKSYREHFKSEWHRFNLKRKLKNLPTIKSEEEFLSLSVADLQI